MSEIFDGGVSGNHSVSGSNMGSNVIDDDAFMLLDFSYLT